MTLKATSCTGFELCGQIIHVYQNTCCSSLGLFFCEYYLLQFAKKKLSYPLNLIIFPFTFVSFSVVFAFFALTYKLKSRNKEYNISGTNQFISQTYSSVPNIQSKNKTYKVGIAVYVQSFTTVIYIDFAQQEKYNSSHK